MKQIESFNVYDYSLPQCDYNHVIVKGNFIKERRELSTYSSVERFIEHLQDKSADLDEAEVEVAIHYDCPVLYVEGFRLMTEPELAKVEKLRQDRKNAQNELKKNQLEQARKLLKDHGEL